MEFDLPTRFAALAPAVAYGSRRSRRVARRWACADAGVALTLHAILATVGAKPPYVLVGHSWGGLLVRMFVELYPSEVAGLVYIDPIDVRSPAEEEAYYHVATAAKHHMHVDDPG